MDKCKDCSAEIGIDEEACPQCGKHEVEILSSGPKKNWLSDFKYINFFAALFWPMFALTWVVGLLGISSSNDSQHGFIFLSLMSFFLFCGANYFEKTGEILGRFSDLERAENPEHFNYRLNTIIVISLFLLFVSFAILLK